MDWSSVIQGAEALRSLFVSLWTHLTRRRPPPPPDLLEAARHAAEQLEVGQVVTAEYSTGGDTDPITLKLSKTDVVTFPPEEETENDADENRG